MKQENLKKFIDYGNPLYSDSVFWMFVGQLMVCTMIVVLSYDWLRTLMVISPLIIIGAVINIVFWCLKEKRETNKYIFLFFGIMGILSSITSAFGCFLLVKLSFKQKLLMAAFLIAISLLMHTFIILISKRMINGVNKFSKAEAVSTSVIAPFAVLGILLSRNLSGGYHTTVFLIAFAVLSFCLNAFSFYIIKYLCIVKLEKMTAENQE